MGVGSNFAGAEPFAPGWLGPFTTCACVFVVSLFKLPCAHAPALNAGMTGAACMCQATSRLRAQPEKCHMCYKNDCDEGAAVVALWEAGAHTRSLRLLNAAHTQCCSVHEQAHTFCAHTRLKQEQELSLAGKLDRCWQTCTRAQGAHTHIHTHHTATTQHTQHVGKAPELPVALTRVGMCLFTHLMRMHTTHSTHAHSRTQRTHHVSKEQEQLGGAL